jgi:hypothetical protein
LISQSRGLGDVYKRQCVILTVYALHVVVMVWLMQPVQ